MSILKRLIMVSFLACSLIVATSALAGDTLKQIVDAKVLKVGMSADQPPMNAVSKIGQVHGLRRRLGRIIGRCDES